MAWSEIKETCTKCGSPLYEDTSTGEVVCLECEEE